MKIVAVIQARLGSTRLPGKVMADLGGHPVLRWVIRAALQAAGVDEVVVATTLLPADLVIVEWCLDHGVECFGGSEDDVLARYYGLACDTYRADAYLRVTGDEPFSDSTVISEVIRRHKQTGASYTSNVHPRTYPDGLDVECFSFEALGAAHKEATRPVDRECVTTWIARNRDRFPAQTVINPILNMQGERWVLDTPEDMEFCREIVKRWPWSLGPPSQLDILDILDKEPELREINAKGIMNERYYQTLADEPLYERTFGRSIASLAKAEETIPLAAQTFSKSRLQYPEWAPSFLSHGEGGLVWDIDGNEYVDLVSGLLPNVLGYCDPDVDEAVRSQLSSGTSFSLATKLESQLAEKLRELIPCAEMSRFAKNGTDVTTAAIRLARHITQRDLVLSSGYHGWADWSIAHDPVRNAGVPNAIKELTTVIRHGDMAAAHRLIESRRYACCIVEPETDRVFLHYLRNVCSETGTLLIFDEIITGFRFDLGGAQKLYGITPDLATFGKSIGNGHPISALVGKKKYMEYMDEICFSGTFFGDAMGLAAALATIAKMQREPVLDTIHKNSDSLVRDLVERMDAAGANYVIISNAALPRLSFLDISTPYGLVSGQDIKTLFMQEMIKYGVLVIGSLNLCYAHTTNDLHKVIKAFEAALVTLKEGVENYSVKQLIKGRSISASANVRAAE